MWDLQTQQQNKNNYLVQQGSCNRYFLMWDLPTQQHQAKLLSYAARQLLHILMLDSSFF